MLRWIGNALASSIGKKVVMALTGLLLVGFLLEHLYGNLKLVPPLGTADGSAFLSYREELHSWGWLLKVGEIGLFALFACHAYLAFRLTLENREARRSRYAVRNDRGAQTAGSVSMFYTGALILAYLIKHLLDFRLDAAYHEAPAAVVARTLSRPLHGAIYVAVSLLVGVHLSHGVQSALQSFGANHPRWTPLVRVAGRALSFALALGFAAIPAYFLLLWSPEGANG